MKLIAQVRLYPTDEQHRYLKETLEKANTACNLLSEYAWEHQTFRQYDLHQAQYYAVRETTGLAAQVVVRCIAKVADGYKADFQARKERQKRAKKPKAIPCREKLTFKPYGAIAYDERVLSWNLEKQIASVWSVGGRLAIPYKGGERQLELLNNRMGETDLVFHKGAFYLLAVCDIPDPDERDVEGAIGVDMGVVNIAITSDGDIYTNEVVERNRQRMHKTRRRLQKANTRGAKRKLKKLSGKQSRFQTQENHRISKRIVELAERTGRAIHVEELTGITERTRAFRKEQRDKHNNWSFRQLQDFLEYKAKRAGIPFRKVDPRYTSQRCNACGYIEKANRKSQSEFLCCACGHEAHADVNAATNISVWAVVTPPDVSL